MVVAEGPEEVMLQVVLAGPQELDRLAGRLRDERRLADEVIAEATAEATTRTGHVDRDGRPWQAGERMHHALRAGGALHRRDHAGALRLDVHEGVLWLERGVRHERHPIPRFDGSRGGLARRGEVAVVAHHASLAREQFVALAVERRARLAGEGPVRPFDVERLATPERRPGVVRDHRDAGGQDAGDRLAGLRSLDHHDVAYAGDPPRRGVVIARDAAVEVRAAQHHGGERAGWADVDAVARASGHDVPGVDHAPCPPDDAVLGRRLGRDRLERQLQGRGARDQLAVAQAAAVGVKGRAGARRDGAHVHAPGGGRRGAHQPAPLRTDLAQVGPGVGDVGAATGALRAPLPARRLAAEVDPEWQLLDRDVVPVDVEFLGQDHRQRGLHALADFRAACTDGDPVVRVDAHIQAERIRRRDRRGLGGLGDAAEASERRPQQQAAAGGQRCRQEQATADFHRRAHRPAPPSAAARMACAARVIALRTRT